MTTLEIQIAEQKILIFKNNKYFNSYLISTAKKGVGETHGSEQTPRGAHIVRAKIGKGHAANTVFVGRRPTGEIYHPSLRQSYPERDWILTRIFWLSGLEVGKNRLGKVDTMRRYIYIHGSPDDVAMGQPGSKGCIRMHNKDIIELFDQIPIGTRVLIR
ncbi:MAG: peptidase [Gammaproteobacteria bacterium RIFCSPHIGHO2_12_FULL_37_14]|nr:MAG: peptidase [Gammaproteobacteria bacterium RIFCSPHIGHO2_12_FULL_37_14]